STDLCVRLTERLRTIRLPGVEVLVEPVKEHRFVLVLRARSRAGAAKLSAQLSESDPQLLDKPPLTIKALHPKAKATAALVNKFVAEARRLLADATPAIRAAHGWQPVPVLVWSRYCGADVVTAFTERACGAGSLGVIPAQHLMPLVMANALRLTKFGA